MNAKKTIINKKVPQKAGSTFIISLLVMSILGIIFLSPLVTSADPGSDSFDNYKRITLTNTNNSYQMFINISKATNGGDVNCSNHCQDDFGDVRFYSLDNSTMLDYWFEKYTFGKYAWAWIELPSTIETDYAIWLKYGNLTMSYVGNGSEVFYYFDNWTVDHTSDWWQYHEGVDNGNDTTSVRLNNSYIGHNTRLRFSANYTKWIPAASGGVSVRYGYSDNVSYAEYPGNYTGWLETTLTGDGANNTLVPTNDYIRINETGKDLWVAEGYTNVIKTSNSSKFIRDLVIASNYYNTSTIAAQSESLVFNRTTTSSDYITPNSGLKSIYFLAYHDNGIFTFTHNATQGTLQVGGHRGATSWNVLNIDYMFISKFNVVEPTVETLGAEQSDGNTAPTQTNENPASGSIGISASLSQWTVFLSDDSSNFSFSIECSNGNTVSVPQFPNSNGTKTLTLGNGLVYSTKYYVYVNASDGTLWTNNTYNFTTGADPNAYSMSISTNANVSAVTSSLNSTHRINYTIVLKNTGSQSLTNVSWNSTWFDNNIGQYGFNWTIVDSSLSDWSKTTFANASSYWTTYYTTTLTSDSSWVTWFVVDVDKEVNATTVTNMVVTSTATDENGGASQTSGSDTIRWGAEATQTIQIHEVILPVIYLIITLTILGSFFTLFGRIKW